MLDKLGEEQSASAHVIVLGNEKGGTGKSTVAMHVAVGLLKAGQQVATIDLDARQQSITRYIYNRQAWAARTGLGFELPSHFCIQEGGTMQVADNEEFECQRFIDAVTALDRNVDFLVIDTPGSESYLSRLAHSMADTLITPMNDSFVDFDVLGSIDPIAYDVTGVAQYAAMVRQARRRRRQIDGSKIDWIVMRNRRSGVPSRNTHALSGCLKRLSLELGFRPIDGFVERPIYREFFPQGVTALDDTGAPSLHSRPDPDQIDAREEVRTLLDQLKLPLNERAHRRAAARADWLSQVGKPLQTDELLSADLLF
jgi:chromosome partitioning protein